MAAMHRWARKKTFARGNLFRKKTEKAVQRHQPVGLSSNFSHVVATSQLFLRTYRCSPSPNDQHTGPYTQLTGDGSVVVVASFVGEV